MPWRPRAAVDQRSRWWRGDAAAVSRWSTSGRLSERRTRVRRRERLYDLDTDVLQTPNKTVGQGVDSLSLHLPPDSKALPNSMRRTKARGGLQSRVQLHMATRRATRRGTWLQPFSVTA